MTTVYRPGDLVEVLRPKWVKRVGYALHWKDLVDKVEADPRTALALRMVGWHGREAPRYFIQTVAKMRVEQRGFGGNERKIIYHELLEPCEKKSALDLLVSNEYPSHGYVGRHVLVIGKRVAYTGTRYPACGHGEDWEPAQLADRRAHVILNTTHGEIEACNVRLVRAADAK